MFIKAVRYTYFTIDIIVIYFLIGVFMQEEYEQEKAKQFRSEYMRDRNIDELLGIAKGVLSDGVVKKEEVQYLIEWIQSHFSVDAIDTYPINAIYDRLIAVLSDDKLTESEAEDIKNLLNLFTGGKPIVEQVADMSSTLPLCKPEPDVDFSDKTFCFTGAFTIGTRTQCEALVKSLGAKTAKNITKKVDYLVIGIIGSGAWIHSSYGRKIEKAVEYREKGNSINIISEEHLIQYL